MSNDHDKEQCAIHIAILPNIDHNTDQCRLPIVSNIIKNISQSPIDRKCPILNTILTNVDYPKFSFIVKNLIILTLAVPASTDIVQYRYATREWI